MDGRCILQRGAYETEFNVCILLYANTDKNILTLFQYSSNGTYWWMNNLLFELFVVFTQLELSLHMKLFAVFQLIFIFFSLKLTSLRQILLPGQ